METSRNPSGISYDQFQHMISEMGLDKAKGHTVKQNLRMRCLIYLIFARILSAVGVPHKVENESLHCCRCFMTLHCFGDPLPPESPITARLGRPAAPCNQRRLSEDRAALFAGTAKSFCIILWQNTCAQKRGSDQLAWSLKILGATPMKLNSWYLMKIIARTSSEQTCMAL